MLRRYIVTAVLTTDERFDGTTTEQAKEILGLAVSVGSDAMRANLKIDAFEVTTIEEDATFCG